MKNKIAIIAGALLISAGAFAQKEELKTLKKIYAKDIPTDLEMMEYKAAISKAESMSLEQSDKLYIDFYKAMAPIIEMNNAMAKPENANKPQVAVKYMTVANVQKVAEVLPAVLEYEKKSGKKLYTTDIEETITSFSPLFFEYAKALGNANNYKDAAKILHSLYDLNKKNAEYLYFAANFAVTAQDYDTALQYFNELKAINYSGEGTTYIATNLASEKEENFATKEERDKLVALKTHIKPREEKLPSKRGEIYKNIALILVQQNKVEEAKAAIAQAKKENPDDTSLLMTEADLYLSLKDTETYKKLISQVLEKNPNDADLVYNLGVINLQAENLVEAEKYFNRAVEINPKYTNAYVNLGAIKLKADKKLVDEMNKLGTSEKDNKRYAVLKKEREDMFRSALVPLEKAYAIDPENAGVIDSLMSVYNYLEMTDKYKALKAKRDKK